MSPKVLKSPSSVGHVFGNEARMFYSVCRATVGDTPTARFVLQSRCTVTALSLEKRTYVGATPIAPDLYDMRQIVNQLVFSVCHTVAPDGTTRCTMEIIKNNPTN